MLTSGHPADVTNPRTRGPLFVWKLDGPAETPRVGGNGRRCRRLSLGELVFLNKYELFSYVAFKKPFTRPLVQTRPSRAEADTVLSGMHSKYLYSRKVGRKNVYSLSIYSLRYSLSAYTWGFKVNLHCATVPGKYHWIWVTRYIPTPWYTQLVDTDGILTLVNTIYFKELFVKIFSETPIIISKCTDSICLKLHLVCTWDMWYRVPRLGMY